MTEQESRPFLRSIVKQIWLAGAVVWSVTMLCVFSLHMWIYTELTAKIENSKCVCGKSLRVEANGNVIHLPPYTHPPNREETVRHILSKRGEL